MNRVVFKLSDIGEGITEAEITAWHVEVGESVTQDQPVADVMTDKATVELSSPVAGIVTARHGEVGDMAKVGAPLLEFGASASDVSPGPPQVQAAGSEAKPFALAAPATRRRAKEAGVNLDKLPGSGPDGRVTEQDLDLFVARAADLSHASGLRPRDGISQVKIAGLRRKIAERMQEAKRRIPHFGYVEEFDMTELELLRRDLNEEAADATRLTLLPFFMRALAKVLPSFPHLNARFDDEAGVLHLHEGVHVGIATHSPQGLLVPVIRHVEALDLWACARELARVTSQARDGKATREELAGSTITLTSLGPLGGIASTPVINYPEVAILAPNRLIERPVVRNGAVTVRTMMNLSASFDHRIIDGYEAAGFIQALKRLLERPALLFVDRTGPANS